MNHIRLHRNHRWQTFFPLLKTSLDILGTKIVGAGIHYIYISRLLALKRNAQYFFKTFRKKSGSEKP